ncbi:MAG: hypothetical protein ACTSV2_09825 [Candidatus Thorarchaeota archaeon]
MKMDKQNLAVLSFMVTILMSLAIMPLSSPVLSNVVVRMSDDASTQQAITTLEANTQNLIVVDYGSLEYSLIINRVAGIVVWVSHGSDQGILVDDAVMSWESFSRNIKMTPSQDAVLACDSSNLDSYVLPSEAFLFDGPIDATIGALITSFILNGAVVVEALIDTILSLVTGEIQIHLLELTLMEFAWDTVVFVVGLLFAGVGFFITEALVMAIFHICTVLFIDTAFIAAEVLEGHLTPLSLVIPLICLIMGIVGALAYLFPGSAWLIYLDAAIMSTPAGYALIAANIGVYIAILYIDWLD